MDITESQFGRIDGETITLYTLTNRAGLTARITNYGAIVTEMHVPDAEGNFADVALGFDTLEEYRDHNPYFGCMAGRCANRVANGQFTLDGVQYQLAQNNGPHHLHGGIAGFDKVVWSAHPRFTRDGNPSLELTYVSPNDEEGYPGALGVRVIYTLTNDNELEVDVVATTDRETIVNIVHHTYWNLAGHDSGDILSHDLQLNADHYTPGDATLIPTGEIAPVADTPFDFRTSRAMGAEIGALPPSGDDPGGYDLNYVVNRDDDSPDLVLAATASDPASGRCMEIWTNQPGIQFYTGNFLDDVPGKNDVIYAKHAGFCLETQKFPDAINKQGREGWPSVILRPGETYHHVMVHRFLTK